MPDKTKSSVSVVCLWFFSLHLVPAVLPAALVNKREGLPADLGALTRGAVTPLEDPPLGGEPPIEDGLKLRPFDGAQEDHGFCSQAMLSNSQTCKYILIVFYF